MATVSFGAKDAAAASADGILKQVLSQASDELQKYVIQEQDFVGALSPAVAELFRLEDLPDNPYPFLLERLRAIELRQSLTHAHPSNALPAAPTPNDLVAATNQITHVRGSAQFFGLPHVMKWVHVPSLTLLKQQLAEFLPTQVSDEDECHIVRLSSLRGETCLFSRLCPSVNIIEAAHDFVIEGKSFDKAVTCFARRVLASVFSLSQHEHHVFLALHIGTTAPAVRAVVPSVGLTPTSAALAAQQAVAAQAEAEADRANKTAAALAGEPMFEAGISGLGGVRTQTWSAAQCQANLKAVQKALKAAVAGKRAIFFEVLLRTQGGEEQRMAPKHARFHCAMHYVTPPQSADAARSTPQPPPSSMTALPALSLLFGLFFSRADAELYASVYHLQTAQGGRMISAFDMTSQLQYLRELMQQHVFESESAGEIRQIFVSMLVLAMVIGNQNIITEVYRYLNCSAGQFYGLMRELQTIKLALASFLQQTRLSGSNSPSGPSGVRLLNLVQSHCELVVDRLRELLTVFSSSECLGVAARLHHLLDSVLDTGTRRFVATPKTLLTFDEIAHLCRAISASSSTAIYQLSPNISQALAELYKLAGRAQRVIPPIGLERRVLSVSEATAAAVAAQRFPTAIARESVLLQYFVDAEVDRTLVDACSEVFSTALVPNPFVRITCAFKSAALAFENFKEPDEALNAALVRMVRPAAATAAAAFQRSASISSADVSSDTSICSCAQHARGDAELLGSSASLQLVNSKLLHAVARDLYRPQTLLVPKVLIKVPVTYHLMPMLCLSGDSALWGSVCDAIPFVTLRHAYCVEGPRRSTAVELFAQQIIEYLLRLHDYSDHAVLGLFIGTALTAPPPNPTVTVASLTEAASRTPTDFSLNSSVTPTMAMSPNQLQSEHDSASALMTAILAQDADQASPSAGISATSAASPFASALAPCFAPALALMEGNIEFANARATMNQARRRAEIEAGAGVRAAVKQARDTLGSHIVGNADQSADIQAKQATKEYFRAGFGSTSKNVSAAAAVYAGGAVSEDPDGMDDELRASIQRSRENALDAEHARAECQHLFVGRLKNERAHVVAAISSAIARRVPIYAVVYVNMSGRYTAVRQDFQLFYSDSNTNRVHAAGAYDPHALFANLWINAQIKSNDSTTTPSTSGAVDNSDDFGVDSETPAERVARAKAAAAQAAEDARVAAENKAATEAAEAFAARQTYAFGAYKEWLRLHHEVSSIGPVLHTASDDVINRSRVFGDASWSLKLQTHLAFESGDLFTAYHMLLRYQLMREDTSSVAAVRRLNSSFVGQAQRALWEGGHIVALLRGMQTSNELKLRVKNDVLIVQFLEWRAALYRVLNSDSFVFMIGLREVISARVADVYDQLTSINALDPEYEAPLRSVLELLHVVALAAAHFFHQNCPEIEAQLRQNSAEVREVLLPGAGTPLPRL